MERVDTVIYHSPCNDGFGAAFVAWTVNPQCEFIGLSHEDPVPVLEGKNVLVFDFSWKRDIVEKLNLEANSLLIFDHHKTAKEELEGLDYCRFDMDRSGVMLAWDYFYPNKKIPDFLYYIGLRDLWKHLDNADATAFTQYFALEYDFVAWNDFYQNPALTPLYIKLGNDILDENAKFIEEMAQNAVSKFWCGYEAHFIEASYPFTSDLGHYLVKGTDSIAIMWCKKDDHYRISLRSEGPDVGALAKKYGGGGHKCSAGFTMNEHPDLLFK